MKGQQRFRQFQFFRKFAKAAGFGQLRQADFRTYLVLKTSAAQETAAGVQWTADFFKEDSTYSAETGDTINSLLVNRTKEPTIQANSPVANEFLSCARALSVEVDHQVTTLTETELTEMLHKLGRCMLQIKNGKEIVYERRVGYLLAGYPGIDVREGTLAAGAATGIRGRIHPMREGDDLDDAMIIFPGGSVSAQIIGDGAWTTTDDIPLELNLHGWVAAKGAIAAGAQVLNMSDLMDSPDLARAALKAA